MRRVTLSLVIRSNSTNITTMMMRRSSCCYARGGGGGVVSKSNMSSAKNTTKRNRFIFQQNHVLFKRRRYDDDGSTLKTNAGGWFQNNKDVDGRDETFKRQQEILAKRRKGGRIDREGDADDFMREQHGWMLRSVLREVFVEG